MPELEIEEFDGDARLSPACAQGLREPGFERDERGGGQGAR